MEMARQIAHQMRVDGKHMPPAGSPMHQQRLPAIRPGCYPEHAHMVSIPDGSAFLPESPSKAGPMLREPPRSADFWPLE